MLPTANLTDLHTHYSGDLIALVLVDPICFIEQSIRSEMVDSVLQTRLLSEPG